MPSFSSTLNETDSSVLIRRLKEAEATEEIQAALDRLEEMATEENAMPAAKGLYGLAYLMNEKTWYDFKRGFDAVMEYVDSWKKQY